MSKENGQGRVLTINDVPESDDLEVDEPTPITDLAGLFRATEQVKAVNTRLFRQDMPQIAKDARLARAAAQEASEQVVIVRTRQEDFSKRQDEFSRSLKEMEQRGHPCAQVEAIRRLQEGEKVWQRDKEAGIETRAMVRAAQTNIEAAANEIADSKKKIESMKGGPRKVIAAIVLAALGMVGTVIGVSWRLSGSLTTVQSSIVTEAAVREAQMVGLKERLGQLPSKSDTPTKQQFNKVENYIKANGHSFDARCRKLTKAQRAHLERQVRVGALPPEMRCPEPGEVVPGG